MRASRSPVRRRLVAALVNSRRHSSPAAWPWLSLMSLKSSRSIISSAKASAAAARTRAFLVQPRQELAAVGGAGEIVEQCEIRDLGPQPVDGHQQETEVPHHREEHQAENHHSLKLVEFDQRDRPADMHDRSRGPRDVDGDHQNRDIARQPRARICVSVLARQQQGQRHRNRHCLSRRINDDAHHHVVVPDEERQAGEIQTDDESREPP